MTHKDLRRLTTEQLKDIARAGYQGSHQRVDDRWEFVGPIFSNEESKAANEELKRRDESNDRRDRVITRIVVIAVVLLLAHGCLSNPNAWRWGESPGAESMPCYHPQDC